MTFEQQPAHIIRSILWVRSFVVVLVLYRFVLCNDFLKFYLLFWSFDLKFLVKLERSYINCARELEKYFIWSRTQKTFLLGLVLGHCQEQTNKKHF